MRDQFIKGCILATIVVQSTAYALVLRQSRKVSADERYLTSTVVLMSECLKLVLSILLYTRENESARATIFGIYNALCREKYTFFKIGVISGIYYGQNLLIVLALENMSAALFQVVAQIKVITTTIMMVLILQKVILCHQWAAVFILFCGVALAQVPSDISELLRPIGDQNLLLGMMANILACFTSAIASVSFEKMFKMNNDSIWLRNVQLSTWGILLGSINCMFTDGSRISGEGFFVNYNYLTFCVIFLLSMTGILVALVFKYADNILKCFAAAISLILTYCVSVMMNDAPSSPYFVVGAILTASSIFLYNLSEQQLRFVTDRFRGMGLPKAEVTII